VGVGVPVTRDAWATPTIPARCRGDVPLRLN